MVKLYIFGNEILSIISVKSQFINTLLTFTSLQTPYILVYTFNITTDGADPVTSHLPSALFATTVSLDVS